MTTATALALAAEVRSGRRTARDVVEEALAAVAAGNGELHAFLTVLGDEARAQADAVDAEVAAGQRPGPAGRRARGAEGQPVHPAAARPPAARRSSKVGARPTTRPWSSRLRRGRGGRDRQDQHGRVRHGLAPPRTPRSARPATRGTWPGARRLLRRLGRRRGRRLRPLGARAPTRAGRSASRRAVRRGRDEAHLRPASPATGWSPSPARSTRSGPLGHDRGRRRPAASTSSPGTTRCDSHLAPSTPRRPRWPSVSTGLERRAGRRAAETSSTGLRPGRGGPGARRRSTRWPPPGPRSRRSPCPQFRYGLSAYYLIAPAEASSNLARYDGVRYGLRVDAEDAAAMNTATRAAGLRRRGQAPHHARHLRAVGRLLRRLLRQGAAGAHPDHRGTSTAAYGQVDVCSAPTAPTTAFASGREDRRPAGHVPDDVCTIPSNLAGHPAISCRSARRRRSAGRGAGPGPGARRGRCSSGWPRRGRGGRRRPAPA